MRNTVWIIKAGVFTLVLHALALMDMSLWVNHVVEDITSISLLLVLFGLAAPLYFFVKGETPKPVIYLLISGGFHLLWTLLGWGIIKICSTGWDILPFFWAELFLMMFFVGIAVVDLIAMALNRLL